MKDSSTNKKAHERRVFLEFANAAQLAGNHNLIEHRDPPEPDLFFPEISQPCYFELARLADHHYAEFILEMLRCAPEAISPELSKIGYPQRDVLLQKLKKSYQSNELPVHLVLYFDNEASHTQGPIPPMPYGEEAEFVLEPILRESMGPFANGLVF